MRIGIFKQLWRLARQDGGARGLPLLLSGATASSLVADALVNQAGRPWAIVAMSLAGLYTVTATRNLWTLARATYPVPSLPYFVCLAQTRDWYQHALRQQTDTLEAMGWPWRQMQSLYRIHEYDWTYHTTRALGVASAEWVEELARVEEHFGALVRRLDQQAVFHVFLAVPNTIALAFAAKTMRRDPFVVYQHSGIGRQPYAVVGDLSSFTAEEGYHVLSRRLSDYELIEVKSEVGNGVHAGQSIRIIVNLAGHRLPMPHPDCDSAGELEITLKGTGGHISLSTNWLALAQEVSSVILKALDRSAKVHLLAGMPASLAFMVGTILGSKVDVTLWHFNKKEQRYVRAFNLLEM